jgi:hypothetical protein
MTKYTCPTCKRLFHKKNHLDNHLIKKKNPCKSIDILLIETAQNGTNTDFLTHKTAQNSINSINPIVNNDINDKNNLIEDDNKIVCDYCDKEFLRKDSLTRHLKKFCKYKKQNDNKDIMIAKMADEIELLKKNFINNSSNITNNIKNISGDTNYNSINNSNNKTTNNIQNNNVQVNINGFGKEDLDKLNILDAMRVYLKSTGGNIIANMLKYINLNCKYPENHNICISDLSREIVKMHNGKKYIYKKFKNAKYDIVDKIVDNIYEIVNKYKDGDYKKSLDINSKLNINEVSLKLISGEELEESDDGKDSGVDSEDDDKINTDDESSRNTQDIINDLNNMDENIRKMIERREKESKNKSKQLNIEHLNSKRDGLQQITFEKLKEELYNGKNILDI